MKVVVSGVKPNGDYYFSAQAKDGDDSTLFTFECGSCPMPTDDTPGVDPAYYMAGVMLELQRIAVEKFPDTAEAPTLQPLPYTLPDSVKAATALVEAAKG